MLASRASQARPPPTFSHSWGGGDSTVTSPTTLDQTQKSQVPRGPAQDGQKQDLAVSRGWGARAYSPGAASSLASVWTCGFSSSWHLDSSSHDHGAGSVCPQAACAPLRKVQPKSLPSGNLPSQRYLDNKEAIKDKMTWGVVVRATGMSQWGLTGAGEPRGLHTPRAKPQHLRLGHWLARLA